MTKIFDPLYSRIVGLARRGRRFQANPIILRKPNEILGRKAGFNERRGVGEARSEEHTSELQSLMRISYAVFCLKKKKRQRSNTKPNKKNTKRISKKK